MATTYIRFELGQEDRSSFDIGPFRFIQCTYDTLRAERTNGEEVELASRDDADGYWHVAPSFLSETGEESDHYSDFIIYAVA